jgi:putative RecB family exonuclease
METSTEGVAGTGTDSAGAEAAVPAERQEAVAAEPDAGEPGGAVPAEASEGGAGKTGGAVHAEASDGAGKPSGDVPAEASEVGPTEPIDGGAAEPNGGGATEPGVGGAGEPSGAAADVAEVVAAAVAPASLSPSRASDFMQCPLLYRFRVIDKLPEKPSEAATRGTLVHAVLERLFDAPATERTAPRAKSLIPGQWDRLRESRPEVVELFAEDPEGERLARWLTEAEQLVERWFTLEDPTRLEPAERELFVEAQLDSGLKLRGIIDRVDVAPTGEVRIVDYKTGKAPRPEYAEGALFQMKFYALVVWRLKQVVPRRLQLVYLGSGDVLTYDPVIADL